MLNIDEIQNGIVIDHIKAGTSVGLMGLLGIKENTTASVALIPVYDWLKVKLKVNTEAFSFRLFQILRTTVLLFISRIIVKAPNLYQGLRMIKRMFTDVDLEGTV